MHLLNLLSNTFPNVDGFCLGSWVSSIASPSLHGSDEKWASCGGVGPQPSESRKINFCALWFLDHNLTI